MKYTLVLLSALAFAGCKSSTSVGDTPQSGVIRPLAVGNFWKYQWTNLDRFGDTLMVQHLTESIYTDTLVGTETWYGRTVDSVLFGDFMVNRQDGLYVFTDHGPLPNVISLMYPYPAEVGRYLTHKWDPIGFTADSIYLKATNVPITTPAGAFHCYQYIVTMYYNGQATKRDEYYAPNVGLVRSDLHNEEEGYIYEVHELQAYKVK